MNDLQRQVKKILTDDLFIEVAEEEMKEDDSIGTDLGLDSVGFVELATIIGERYDITVDDTDLTSGSFATIKSLCDFVIARTS